MARWIAALLIAAGTTYVAIPAARSWAFRAGWFERGHQTRRTRSRRRPTHGGLVIALALALATGLAEPSEPVTRATAAVCLIAVVTGFQADKGKGSPVVVGVGRVAAAAVLPATGVRVELTGSAAVDAVTTVLLALVLMVAVRSIERTDATGPLVVGISALGLLAIAVRVDDAVAPVAAALVGVSGGLVANTWPPSLVRIGTIGPTVLGAGLATVAIELEPDVASPRSLLVPLLCLVTLGAAAVVPQLDQRLDARGWPSRVCLPVAAAAGAAGAHAVVAGWLALPLAVAVGAVPSALLVVAGLSVHAVRPEGEVSHRRRNLTVGSLAVVGLGLVAVVAGVLLLDARRSMIEGRTFATTGLEAARDGDLELAQKRFERADAAFADAGSVLGNPLVRVGELVPGIAPNLRNARTLAEVGRDLSGTAVAVAERAGAEDLVVVDGRFPVDAAKAVSVELDSALDTLRGSLGRLELSESALLLDEARTGSDDVREQIEEATESLEVVAEATRLAPALMGADGDRRWIVAILTPSEQRGAGGLAGDFAELRASEGDVDLVRTISASEMNLATTPSVQTQALPAVYRQNYAGYRVDRFWQNLSATPDVPTFGQAIADAFPLTEGGGAVDGVITVDPHGLAALLRLTGPVFVPNWYLPVGPYSAPYYLLHEHYNLPEDKIDGFQGGVVEAVVDALTTGSLPPPSELAATLAPAIAGGHLRLWSPAESPQALFERIGADGSLGPGDDGSDFIELVTQSASESKIDWYLGRSLTYEPTVDPDTGAVTATATVTLTNEAPAGGVASYIIGEPSGPTAVGENELRLTLFSPHEPTGVVDAEGRRLPVNLAEERDLHAVTVLVELPAGQSTTLTFTFEGALEPSSGRYRLEVGRQPAVAPDIVEVELSGADGWEPATAASGRKTLDQETDTTFTARLERA